MTDAAPRVPPHSEAAEISLLGSVLLDNDQLTHPVVGQITPESFYRAGHRLIWSCFATLRERRGSDGSPGPVDLTTLAEELMRRGQLDDAGGLPYLIGLSEKTSTAVYAEHFARIVLEKAHLRQVIKHAGETMRALGGQLLPFFAANVLLAPYVEEQLYRNYALTRLSERYGQRWGLLLSAVTFGLLHWLGGAWYILLTAVVIGVPFTLLRRWRGNMLWPYAAHLSLNALEFWRVAAGGS